MNKNRRLNQTQKHWTHFLVIVHRFIQHRWSREVSKFSTRLSSGNHSNRTYPGLCKFDTGLQLLCCNQFYMGHSRLLSTSMTFPWKLCEDGGWVYLVLNRWRLFPYMSRGTQVHAKNVCFVFTLVFVSSQQLNIKTFQQREHSLVKQHQVSRLGVSDGYFMGSTVINKTYIRFTPESHCTSRATWKNVASLVRHLELHIHPISFARG